MFTAHAMVLCALHLGVCFANQGGYDNFKAWKSVVHKLQKYKVFERFIAFCNKHADLTKNGHGGREPRPHLRPI